MYYQEIEGQTVLSIKLDGEDILIETDKIVGKISAYGDCCSRGWIDGLVSVPLPAKIISTSVRTEYPHEDLDREVIDASDPRFPDGGDYVVVYKSFILTENGKICFNVWNDSNGYYASEIHLEVMSNTV